MISIVATAVDLPMVWVAVGILKILLSAAAAAARASLPAIPPRLAPWHGVPTAAAVSLAAVAGPAVAPVADAPGSFPSEREPNARQGNIDWWMEGWLWSKWEYWLVDGRMVVEQVGILAGGWKDG